MHCTDVGLQAPLQSPEVQMLAQAGPVFCQAPAASQVCGCRLLHWTIVGRQTPLQTPAAQRLGQAVPVFCQAPALSQV